MVAFTVLLGLIIHNSGAIPYSLFLFYGSASPTGGNKDKFGRLRSVAVFKTAWLSQRAKMVSDYAKHKDKEETENAGNGNGIVYSDGSNGSRRLVSTR